MFKGLCRRLGINPLDRALRRMPDGARVLVCWNRGLGDIPLGLYALVIRIFYFIPKAKITFLTRADLQEGFCLLGVGEVLVDATWKRGVPFDVAESLRRLGKGEFDLVLDRVDPTNWLAWQLGTLTPRLCWRSEWDSLWKRFSLPEEGECVAVHVQTETVYAYEKNWPKAHWEEFFSRVVKEKGCHVLLFGFSEEPRFALPGVIDLRGKTSLLEMLSIIKNRCRFLVAPDSGVLSTVYYLESAFPLRVVSLWADPKQGVLRQKVASPNPGLLHTPLIAEGEDLSRVPVEAVLEGLYG